MSFVNALVIQEDTTVYISPAGVDVEKTAGSSSNYMTGIGLIELLPDPINGAVVDGDYWAIPVNDNGLVTGWTFSPYNLNDPSQNNPPTIQSFAVFRLWSRLGIRIDWWAVGTTAQYNTAINGGAALPTTLGVNFYQVGCTTLCQFNASNQYSSTWALPVLVGNQRYFPYGFFNNVAFTGGSSTGYSTPAALLAFLNAVWTNVGPINGVVQATLLWSLSPDNLTLSVAETANGTGADVICINIGTVNPSL